MEFLRKIPDPVSGYAGMLWYAGSAEQQLKAVFPKTP